MVNAKYVAIAYFCFFMFIMFASFGYSSLPIVLNTSTESIPMNSYTYSANSMISNSYMPFSIIGLIAVGIIVFLAFGLINIFSAYK